MLRPPPGAAPGGRAARRRSEWSGDPEVAGQQDVRSHPLGGRVRELDGRLELAEEAKAAAGEDRRDEEEQLVDEAGADECGRERGAAFQEEPLHSIAGQRAELRLERAGAQLELGALRERTLSEGEAARLPARVHSARVEARGVRTHRPHADGHGVRSGSELVYPSAALLAGHPARSGYR